MEKHDTVAIIAAMLIAGSLGEDQPVDTEEAIDWAIDIVAMTSDKLYGVPRVKER